VCHPFIFIFVGHTSLKQSLPNWTLVRPRAAGRHTSLPQCQLPSAATRSRPTSIMSIFCSSSDSVSLQDFLDLPRFLFPFSVNPISACFELLLLSILCTCRSHCSLVLISLTSLNTETFKEDEMAGCTCTVCNTALCRKLHLTRLHLQNDRLRVEWTLNSS